MTLIAAKITAFYIIYYSFLAGFFIICLSVFLAVSPVKNSFSYLIVLITWEW